MISYAKPDVMETLWKMSKECWKPSLQSLKGKGDSWEMPYHIRNPLGDSPSNSRHFIGCARQKIREKKTPRQ